jgi:hypothetical protein
MDALAMLQAQSAKRILANFLTKVPQKLRKNTRKEKSKVIKVIGQYQKKV